MGRIFLRRFLSSEEDVAIRIEAEDPALSSTIASANAARLTPEPACAEEEGLVGVAGANESSDSSTSSNTSTATYEVSTHELLSSSLQGPHPSLSTTTTSTQFSNIANPAHYIVYVDRGTNFYRVHDVVSSTEDINHALNNIMASPSPLLQHTSELTGATLGTNIPETRAQQVQQTKSSFDFFACRACGTPLALHGDLLSRNFRGRTGTAVLFDKVLNVNAGEVEESQMTTGVHLIRTLFCVCCQENLGWRYEKAYNEDQKYKEGRYILEEELISPRKQYAPAIRIPRKTSVAVSSSRRHSEINAADAAGEGGDSNMEPLACDAGSGGNGCGDDDDDIGNRSSHLCVGETNDTWRPVLVDPNASSSATLLLRPYEEDSPIGATLGSTSKLIEHLVNLNMNTSTCTSTSHQFRLGDRLCVTFHQK
ncbi:unnamed protein product [Amoebophrya sp. A25]|nr:unnamed protein product [Amoebophrya sp. A25]|eukprot:GSA25T00025609001.1